MDGGFTYKARQKVKVITSVIASTTIRQLNWRVKMTSTKTTQKTKVLRFQDVEQSLGQKLKVLRLQHSLSQEGIGKILGVSIQQVQKYEKGVNRISLSSFILLAKHLKVDPLAFLDMSNLPQQEQTYTDNQFKVVKSFQKFLVKADDKTLKVVRSFLQELSKDDN
jgi:transcriptional regulator with XRE-family HTH domain